SSPVSTFSPRNPSPAITPIAPNAATRNNSSPPGSPSWRRSCSKKEKTQLSALPEERDSARPAQVPRNRERRNATRQATCPASRDLLGWRRYSRVPAEPLGAAADDCQLRFSKANVPTSDGPAAAPSTLPYPGLNWQQFQQKCTSSRHACPCARLGPKVP